MGYTVTKTSPEDTMVLKRKAHGVDLSVSSDDEVAFPPKVIIMKQLEGENEKPTFQCIATPVQMLDLPEDEVGPPVDGVHQPYFRVSSLTIVSRHPTRLADFIAQFEEDVASLEANLENLATLAQ